MRHVTALCASLACGLVLATVSVGCTRVETVEVVVTATPAPDTAEVVATSPPAPVEPAVEPSPTPKPRPFGPVGGPPDLMIEQFSDEVYLNMYRDDCIEGEEEWGTSRKVAEAYCGCVVDEAVKAGIVGDMKEFGFTVGWGYPPSSEFTEKFSAIIDECWESVSQPFHDGI